VEREQVAALEHRAEEGSRACPWCAPQREHWHRCNLSFNGPCAGARTGTGGRRNGDLASRSRLSRFTRRGLKRCVGSFLLCSQR
jgi:hypothetical protein